jgi:hypothetical protein
MKGKKRVNNSSRKDDSSSSGEPKFPYTTAPNALRQFLSKVSDKPKPTKINTSTLKAWGFPGGNSTTIIGVLKAIGLISGDGQPTREYEKFMLQGGGSILGELLRKAYGPIFEASRDPASETPEQLRTIFNVHTGGAERTMQLQIQTFKVLLEYADLKTKPNSSGQNSDNAGQVNVENSNGFNGHAVLCIDLHIHLPENKSKVEYDSIIESLAQHLYNPKKQE